MTCHIGLGPKADIALSSCHVCFGFLHLGRAFLVIVPAMTQLATVDQLLRKAPVVLDASGTPDRFNNLGGVIS